MHYLSKSAQLHNLTRCQVLDHLLATIHWYFQFNLMLRKPCNLLTKGTVPQDKNMFPTLCRVMTTCNLTKMDIWSILQGMIGREKGGCAHLNLEKGQSVLLELIEDLWYQLRCKGIITCVIEHNFVKANFLLQKVTQVCFWPAYNIFITYYWCSTGPRCTWKSYYHNLVKWIK